MCVFSLISLYSQTPGSTLLPVFQKINEIEKKHRQIDEHHTEKKKESREKKWLNKEQNDTVLNIEWK